MDWSEYPIPAMRLEARFGDRVIPLFESRPSDLWTIVAEAAARNPDGEALICGDKRMTWRDVVHASAQLAAGFREVGLQPGDRIGLLLGNRLEFVLAMFGAAYLGLITVMLSTRQQKPEIAYVLTDCGAKLIIHEDHMADRLPDPGDVPELLHRVSMGATVGSLHFEDLMATEPARTPTKVREEDTAMILYTSGTTGRPKGAMLSHCNIVHSSMIYEAFMSLTEEDRSIAAVPLSHVTGVVANVTTMARCAGTLIIIPDFKAGEYLKVLSRERATQSVMVPAMYNLCLLQSDFDSYDLSSWRIGGFGGAPMPIATIERLAQKIPGLQLINVYGSTETTSPSTAMPPVLTATHIDSVGIPCPGVDILIMDTDGRELPRGEVGEIWIRSGSVIKGYWNNPRATAESFTGGYWHSGDLGSIDENNFVRVLDRQKDMINRGGLKIFSAEVESVLASHPAVVESAVVAQPCPVLGERVHAVVVTRLDTDQPTLRAWCAERLSDYKVPETITLSTEPLPRNANGKVMKKMIRDALAASV